MPIKMGLLYLRCLDAYSSNSYIIKMERRIFLKTSAFAGLGAMLAAENLRSQPITAQAPVKIGIIGLDTSHSPAFAKLLNSGEEAAYSGFRVVAAYPYGSRDIKECVDRIPGYQKEFEEMGIEITSSVEELVNKSDVVLLETCDGRPHLEQSIPVIRAKKPMFIDKPIAASLADTIAIFELSAKNKVPVFSSSSLRYMSSVKEVVNGKIGNVIGADTYSPATIEKTHPDLFWYGIHGVEPLFAVMGTGCKSISRTYTENTDVCVGLWNDGRIGTFRGTRSGRSEFGGYVYGNRGNMVLGPWDGYKPLLDEIIQFFKTERAPVQPEETIEIFAFMEAADVSKNNGGKAVLIEEIMDKARIEAKTMMTKYSF